MPSHEQEKNDARVEEEQKSKIDQKKDILSLQERVKLLEDQIKQKSEELSKVSELVEKLKIINTLLHKEVCREYKTLGIPVEAE
ncbi:hypothetical protein NEMIN01_1334 [Nematocida minor]|uniref:uncharacterized protein n=1 Tax=Nematocida minor TaxID=1912983 RepID=UPI0022204C10|nr:uncharacterized protein NEMIN01_1334 [Nematocida minor]KAI5191065.1 hypothetical protein NEMIN01_1334 [Nematocida minor]